MSNNNNNKVSKDVLAIILSCAKATVMNPNNIHDVSVSCIEKHKNKRPLQVARFTYSCDNGDCLDVEITTQRRPSLYQVYTHCNDDDGLECWYDKVEAFYAWVKSGERF